MKSVAATLLAGIVAAGTICAQETQVAPDMAWSLNSGDNFSTKVTVNIDLGMEMPGIPMGGAQNQSFSVEYQLEHKVTESADGVAKVDATIGPVVAKITMPMMGEMAYNSAEDDEQNPIRGIRHLVGKTFSYTIHKDGKISDVSGGDALCEEAAQAAQAESQGGGGGGMMMMDPSMMAAVAMVLFRDNTLGTSLSIHTQVLPADGAKAATYALERQESIATLGTIKFKSDCTTEATEGKIKISYTGKDLTFAAEDVPAEAQGNPMADMQRKLMEGLEVTGSEVKGTAHFDTSVGRVTSSESTRRIDQEGQLPEEFKQMLQMQGMEVQDDMKLIRKSVLTVKVEEVGGDDRRRF